MALKIKYIFGCKHRDRDQKSTTIFEQGLKLPAIYCEDCYGMCDICLKKSKTSRLDELKLCKKCLKNVRKIS